MLILDISRVRTAAFGTLVVASVLAFAGCSATDHPKYPDANSFCKARGEAECSTEVIKNCAAPDATRCIAKRQAACIAATPTGTSYNPNGAEPCINTISASYADAKLSAQENRTITDSCVTVFDGPGQANAACRKDVECKASAGLRCVLRGGSDTGTCQVPERVAGRGVCSAANQACIAGFHCGSTKHCDINGQVGASCTDVLPCVESARCAVAGKCEKKADDGTSCAMDEECLSALCVRVAGSAQGICASQMTLALNEPFCIEAR